MAGIKKKKYSYDDAAPAGGEDMEALMLGMEEMEAPAEEAPAGVDLSSVSDDELLAEAEKRGLVDPAEAEEPLEDEMPEELA